MNEYDHQFECFWAPFTHIVSNDGCCVMQGHKATQLAVSVGLIVVSVLLLFPAKYIQKEGKR